MRRGKLEPLFLNWRVIQYGVLLGGMWIFSAQADNEEIKQRLTQEDIYQQQRQQALEGQLSPVKPDVNFAVPDMPLDKTLFPGETPCFSIHQVQINGTETLPHWLPLQRIANQAQGQCLGARGINNLMRLIQNRLVDHGFVTTRILAPAQDLNSGQLKLQVVAGTIRDVVLSPESDHYVTFFTAFPPREGQLLDLRDIEQGLENLQRVPTVTAQMSLLPGHEPGQSDIQVEWKQSKLWRVGLSLDNSGSENTGKYQGGATLFLDNPLSLSDTFYFSASRDMHTHRDKGTRNLTLHYSLPVGYWEFATTASDYRYHQTVAGLTEDYVYRGKSKNLSVQAKRVLHRSSQQKTTASVEVMKRETRNFINQTEIAVQRRSTTAWRAGLEHRNYVGPVTLDAAVRYQRGTRWFGAQPAPEEYVNEATALSKILTYSFDMRAPFSLGKQQFRYHLQYNRQQTKTALTPQDQFSIGSRWSVRGFDGERSLNANEGWYVRNDLAWATPFEGQELYVGLDYGEVKNTGKKMLVGSHLAGGVLGVRGNIAGVGYELFVGRPFSKPEHFMTDTHTVGFSLNWQF